MTTLEVKIDLPESLAKEAQQAGLLAPEELERLVREALRTKRVERLSKAREKLAAEPLPPMTPVSWRSPSQDSSWLVWQNQNPSGPRHSPQQWYMRLSMRGFYQHHSHQQSH